MIEWTAKEREIVATMTTRRYIYFARIINGKLWFGVQPHNCPHLVQWIVSEHLRDIDAHLLFNKPHGVYEFAPYRYTITVDRIWAIDAPKERITYVSALREKQLMKLLFFAHAYMDVYNEGA